MITEKQIVDLLIDNVHIKRNEEGIFVFTGVEIVAEKINDLVSSEMGNQLIQYANENQN